MKVGKPTIKDGATDGWTSAPRLHPTTCTPPPQPVQTAALRQCAHALADDARRDLSMHPRQWMDAHQPPAARARLLTLLECLRDSDLGRRARPAPPLLLPAQRSRGPRIGPSLAWRPSTRTSSPSLRAARTTWPAARTTPSRSTSTASGCPPTTSQTTSTSSSVRSSAAGRARLRRSLTGGRWPSRRATTASSSSLSSTRSPPPRAARTLATWRTRSSSACWSTSRRSTRAWRRCSSRRTSRAT